MADPSKDSKLSTGIKYGICFTFRGWHRCQIARNRWSMYGEKDQKCLVCQERTHANKLQKAK